MLAGTVGAGYLSRLAGIIPVLAIRGGGYVVAGLAMLAWLKRDADGSCAEPRGLEQAVGVADEGRTPSAPSALTR